MIWEMTPGWHPFPILYQLLRDIASLCQVPRLTPPALVRRWLPPPQREKGDLLLWFLSTSLTYVSEKDIKADTGHRCPGNSEFQLFCRVFPGNLRNPRRMLIFLNPKSISQDRLLLTPTDTNCFVFGDLVKEKGGTCPSFLLPFLLRGWSGSHSFPK